MKTNFDLYTTEIARLTMLKKGFTHVSFRKNSIPGLGSPTYDLNKVKMSDKITVKRTINHKDGSITIISDFGYLKFIKL